MCFARRSLVWGFGALEEEEEMTRKNLFRLTRVLSWRKNGSQAQSSSMVETLDGAEISGKGPESVCKFLSQHTVLTRYG